MVNRTSNYYYDENDKLTRVETHETYDAKDLCNGCESRDEGELLTSEVEIPCEMVSPLQVAALVLSSIGLGISIAKFLRDK